LGGALKPWSSTSAEQLIRACADSNNQDAWRELVARFHRPICLTVIRISRQWGSVPRHLEEDLVQETFLKLCADKCQTLLSFAIQHPDAISGYVKTVAANLVHDYFRSRNAQKRGAGQPEESMEDTTRSAKSRTLGGEEAMERQILLKQIDGFLEQCSFGPDQERDRLIFWLYYQQGMSAKAIAALPTVKLSAKGVESAILRLTRLIRERVIAFRSDDRPIRDKKGFQSAESY
jgi:RNA polymerase sigma-70 factor (ECF subfamily)